MDKEKMINSTDTVCITDENVRVISEADKRSQIFDYTYFCRKIMEKTKRWIDANFLVPLKLLRECEEVRKEEFYELLEKWMKIFKEKEGSIESFWIYMVYIGGYNKFKEQSEDDDIRKSISKNVSDDAQTYVNDVSKLEKAKYIAQQCERGEMYEYWILKVYEITVKQIYSSADMVRIVDRIITYLQECGKNIERPAFTDYGQSDNAIYIFASNLMLYVTRLHLKIDADLALRKYKKGNVAYSRYRDHMLAEYIRLSDSYFYQSYERLIKMQACAMKGGNIYAAKEVGDIYRLGMGLQDMHGNRIVVEADEKTACEYYRICLDAEYIPAYVPAVKTGALISMKQQEEILKTAVEEKSPEGLAYYTEKWIKEADAMEAAESDRALEAMKNAVNAMTFMEDSYAEKHVLKNALLQSKTFTAYKSSKSGKEEELNEMLWNLYSGDVTAMDKDAILAEMEKTYIAAGECGFFEAEYQLGKLFQDSNVDKSNEYFERGKAKGCVWCLLECAQEQREQDPEGWLKTMMKLGRNMNGDDALCVRMAEEWTSGDDVLKRVADEDERIELEIDEIMEIYLQIGNLFECIYGKGADRSEKKRNSLLSTELSKQQNYLKEFILKNQKETSQKK